MLHGCSPIETALLLVGAQCARSLLDQFGAAEKAGAQHREHERALVASLTERIRALDPDILVLDEATSNVDSETEARLQNALDVLLEGRTALIVAHRLSTIRKVDRIVVLQHGRIVEQGSHDELMAKDGLYRNLAELQFSAVTAEA